jgi:chemotaxis protein CheC
MPQMDGFKILKKLHDEGSRIPVIVVTADIQVSVQKQCLALGAVALMNKPPQEKELLKTVREVLSIQKKGPATREATSVQMDALKELINIGVGKASASLNEMLKLRVNLDVPFVKVLSPLQFKHEMADLGDKNLSAVKMGFFGPFSGTGALVIAPQNGSRLVRALVGASSQGGRLVVEETMKEVGNIVLNGVLGSLANILKQHISYSLPVFTEVTIKKLFFSEKIGNDTVFLLVRTRFKIQEIEVEGSIILLFTVGAFDTLLSAIDEMNDAVHRQHD